MIILEIFAKFKQAYEDKEKLLGRDWITNFDFDKDGDFSNNMNYQW